MPVLAVIGVFFQVLFAVHAVKTGRDRLWVYLIVFFPGIGCLVYFFAEYLPELQHGRGLRTFTASVGRALNPGKQLRLLQQQVELTPSVKNKKALAEAYVNQGLFDEAIALYKSCRQGAHEQDPHLLEGLGCAYFFKGDYHNAKTYLEAIVAHPETAHTDRFRLMLARTLEALGHNDEAGDLYASVVRTFSGEEARCRYALHLKKMGRGEQADRLFDDILKNARLSPKYYKRTQKTWVTLAKTERSRQGRSI